MRHSGILTGSLALLLTCTACASVSNVSTVGKDTYTVGSDSRGGFQSWAEVKAMAIQKAEAHCTSLGKHVSDVKTETHGARGWTPMEAEVTFRCLDADDPEYQRPTSN